MVASPSVSAVGGKDRFIGWLIAIAVGGLAIRVGYVLVFRTAALPLPFYDALIFHNGANALAQGHGFVEFVNYRYQQSAAHPPLYLLWLGIVSWLSPGHSATPTTHMLWSCLLGVGTVIVCGLCGREIAGRRVGIIAAVFAAVYPNLWINDGLLMSEGMALLCTAGVLYCAYRFIHRPSLWRAVWLGLLCGLAALSRSELVLTVPFVLGILVLTARDVTWARRLQWLAAGALVSVAVFGPWVAFNLSRFDKPVYLSSQFGTTLVAANCNNTYYGSNLGFKDYQCQAVSYDEAARTVPGFKSQTLAEKDGALSTIGKRYVKDHLSRVPVVVLARWGRILGVYHPMQEVTAEHRDFELERWAGILLTGSFWVALALAVVGGVGLRRRHERLWPLLALPVIVLMSVAITFGQTRYRAPAEISLVLLGAVGVEMLWRRYRREPGVAQASASPERTA